MLCNYENYEHYIKEGWSPKPKEIFTFLKSFIPKEFSHKAFSCLDIGCATGELIAYLSQNYPLARFTGIDVFDDLIEHCRLLQPDKTFMKESVLALPDNFEQHFDLITVVGVLSIFDETELEKFFANLFSSCKPGGFIYILSPFNEFGIDCEIKHRKRKNSAKGTWEKGWNIFSKETISEFLEARCQFFEFHPFKLSFPLTPKEDPIRTWTLKTEFNERQLTNGLKLLVDHSLLVIKV